MSDDFGSILGFDTIRKLVIVILMVAKVILMISGDVLGFTCICISYYYYSV